MTIQGRLQGELIVGSLASHIAEMMHLPPDERSQENPRGALGMATVAVSTYDAFLVYRCTSYGMVVLTLQSIGSSHSHTPQDRRVETAARSRGLVLQRQLR